MQSSAPYRPIPSSRQPAAVPSEDSDRCPFLGTVTDAATAHEFPSDVNRCYSTRLGVPVSTIHQENYCLSSRFEGCPVYRERIKRAGGETIVPPSVIATVAASSPLVWHEATTPAVSAPTPVESAANEPEVAPTPDARPLDAGAPLLFPWEGEAHPDFQADLAAEPYRRRSRSVSLRPVLLGLLLLALIPLAWWLWTTVRPGIGDNTEGVGGTVVTLPTMASADNGGAEGDRGATSDLPPGVADEGAVAGGAADGPTAEATAEPTKTDLERIAATATALFMNATPVTDCVAPSWWVAYLVEEGDTIEVLATTRGITAEALIVANCLASPDLTPGLTLLLPPVGVVALLPGPSPTVMATATRVPRVPGLPTRPPIFLPVPTFPVVIIVTPQVPIPEPTDQPDGRPPIRATSTPSAPPTATAPNPLPPVTSTRPATLTPPAAMTLTPPPLDATMTPPGPDG